MAEAANTDWDDLRIALAIGRARGLAGAARVLALNQATVWRRLKALEARLGVRLFDRRSGGYVPTAAGDELCRSAETMEEAAEALNRRISGHDLRLTGTVRLSTLDSYVHALIGPQLVRLRARLPGIAIELSQSNALASFTRRDADIALRATDTPPETLVGQRVGDVAMAVYGTPERLALAAPDAPWTAHDWLASDEAMAHTPFTRLIEREAAGRIVFRADTVMGLHAAASAGLGLTILPCYLGDPDPRLARLGPPIASLTHGLWLLTHQDLRGNARIRAVLDTLAATIRADRAKLLGERAPDQGEPVRGAAVRGKTVPPTPGPRAPRRRLRPP